MNLSDKTKMLLRNLLTVELENQRCGLKTTEVDIAYKRVIARSAHKGVVTRAQHEIDRIEKKASEIRVYIADLEEALREVTS